MVEEARRERVYDFIRKELGDKHRAFIVCPLVSESEKSDLRAATDMVERIRAHPAFRGYRRALPRRAPQDGL